MKAVNEEAGWQHSNPLFFLTKEIELMCKAAEERAKGGRKEFDRAGVKKGLQIWRIEMARAKPWDYRKYGKFHRGDSYIILNCYPGENGVKLMYDVHFWSASRPIELTSHSRVRASPDLKCDEMTSARVTSVQLARSPPRMSMALLHSRRLGLTRSCGSLESAATRIVR